MKNWRCFSILAAAVPLALATSATVHAQSADGYLNDDTPLYAGPAPEYPQIEALPYGTYVSVQGCTEGWQWCDVVAQQGDWGWVPGDYIDYMYQDQPVVLTEYGPRIGIPIVSFSITSYWDAHYRDRPFYRERDSWYHRDIPHRAPPPPHHVADRRPPPPPPGGWHHGGPQTAHRGNASQAHHGNAQAYHGGASQAPRHENPPQQSYRQNPPNPPRAPLNEPQRPQGDHHANVPTPPMGAPPHPVPPRNGHVPPPPHSSSSTDHGKQPPHPKKKDDHDNGNDNGH